MTAIRRLSVFKSVVALATCLLLRTDLAHSQDPARDDDGDILEVLFDASSSNDELLKSYRAVYQVTYFDRTVDQPTERIAKAVGGKAVIRHEVHPERTVVHTVMCSGSAILATTTDSTGKQIEAVRHDLLDGTWEIYSPEHKRLERMLAGDLPSRLPVRPRRLWMHQFGQSQPEYIASLTERADANVYIRDEGVAGVVASRHVDGVQVCNGIEFSAEDGMLPTLSVSGYDGALSSVVAIRYRQLENGGRVADLASIYYAEDNVSLNCESPFTVQVPPPHTQEVRFQLAELAESVPEEIPRLIPDEGTDVIDMVHSTQYRKTDNRQLLRGSSEGNGSNVSLILALNALFFCVLLGFVFAKIRRRQRD